METFYSYAIFLITWIFFDNRFRFAFASTGRHWCKPNRINYVLPNESHILKEESSAIYLQDSFISVSDKSQLDLLTNSTLLVTHHSKVVVRDESRLEIRNSIVVLRDNGDLRSLSRSKIRLENSELMIDSGWTGIDPAFVASSNSNLNFNGGKAYLGWLASLLVDKQANLRNSGSLSLYDGAKLIVLMDGSFISDHGNFMQRTNSTVRLENHSVLKLAAGSRLLL